MNTCKYTHTMMAFCVATMLWSPVAAQPISSQPLVISPDKIVLSLGKPIESFDKDKSILYVVVNASGGLRLVQLRFKVEAPATLNGFTCLDGKPVSLNGTQGSCLLPPAAGEYRKIQFDVAGLKLKDDPKPSSQSLTGTYPKGLELVMAPSINKPGSSAVYFSVRPFDRTAAILKAIQKCPEAAVNVIPAPEDNIKAFKIEISSARLNLDKEVKGWSKDKLVRLELKAALPNRELKYKMAFVLPKVCLDSADQTLIPEGDDNLSAGMAMTDTPAPAQPATPPIFNPPTVSGQAYIKADLTFTSYVNPFDSSKAPSAANSGKRRNVGLADVTVQNSWAIFRQNGTAVKVGATYHGNVSTLPLREAKVPTQAEHQAGFELQQDIGKNLGQVIFGASGVWETDRDYKFQVAVGRFSFTPVFPNFYQPRDIRTYNLSNGYAKASWISAFHLIPTVAYETGDVVSDRPERLIPNVNFQDRISRVRTTLNLNVEFNRVVAISIRDDYFYMQNVARRPSRNYLDAAMTLDPRPLFGTRALGGFESAFVIKFQRGETAPAFLPVNLFSLGIKLTR
jgi:hypothetical protein